MFSHLYQVLPRMHLLAKIGDRTYSRESHSIYLNIPHCGIPFGRALLIVVFGYLLQQTPEEDGVPIQHYKIGFMALFNDHKFMDFRIRLKATVLHARVDME